MKTEKQIAAAAAAFAERWHGKGYEKGETQRFWLDLLHNVFGEDDPTKTMQFEIPVKTITKEKGADFIDGYITPTKVLIEQKGSHIDLAAKAKQSDNSDLTPYKQARRYAEGLPLSQKPRWIITCNFKEFWVYDMEHPNNEPQKISLENLEKEYYRLQFLVDLKNENVKREEELSLKAGVLVGKLYDALIKEYIDPDDNSFRSLNILCVRIVFCLYAEDAGLFETKTSFEDYIKSFSLENLRDGIIKLFKALDTRLEQRDKYDTKLKPFPYVNGGLFCDEQIEIPNFTEEIVDVIVNHCAPFDWRDISPTIFGAVFESTLNPETRRKGGMHYTSIANIHKVIDPLFMDDLNAEFEAICTTKIAKQRDEKLLAFQHKLGSLTFLDPACGSGNFLTETYLSLRRLENKVITLLNRGERVFGFDEFICVKINQFYGIEINDFAVTVAKTALWIAESQMVAETESILSQTIDFLPLTTNAFIVEGNALRMDWSTLKPTEQDEQPKEGLFTGFTTETDGRVHHYDYIMGNPPFVGARWMDREQKQDVIDIFGPKWKNIGNLDYVCCWYKKAAELMQSQSDIKAAFVSTNSITQGEQVAILWRNLFEQYHLRIVFAYRTFQWDSEAEMKAHVHCVIVGFKVNGNNASKTIFLNESQSVQAENINGYLMDAPNVWIESRNKPICDVPEIGIGNKPIDGGYYLFTDEEKSEFLKKEPKAQPYFRRWFGAEEFINNKIRWCLWLGDCTPAELRSMPLCYERVRMVYEYRLKSPSPGTVKLADKPTRFHVENMPKGNFIVIPEVSSGRRHYIPIGYMDDSVLCSNKLRLMPQANLFYFGVLTSKIHNAWMRVVCGRLKSDYSYSVNIVYNNFPWCNPTEEQRKRIEQTAQSILDARSQNASSTLADLYDEISMPSELRKAHRENDKAVMAAYGFKPNLEESEIVAELFRMYQGMIKSIH
jgi:hypothetical protein